MRLVCFGDSICYGYGAASGTAWADRAAASLAALPRPVQLINAGVSGETTSDALRRMRQDVEMQRPDAVYIQFGLNDCSFWCGQQGKPWVEKSQYTANMRTLVDRAFGCGSRRVFVATNHPVAGNPPPFGTNAYQALVREYNEALRQTFPVEQGLTLVDLERLAEPYCQERALQTADLVLADGVHLSAAGNDYYVHTLLPLFTATFADQ